MIPRTPHRPRLRPGWGSIVVPQRGWGFLLARLSVLFVAAGCAPHQAPGQEVTPFRIGFSSTCFDEVNENDAKAAVKVWAQALAKERGIPADPQPYILKGADEIASALNEKRIDAISLTTEQYFALKQRVALNQCIVSVTANSFHDEYVLLVHRDSGIDRLGQLRGRTLAVLGGPRAALASAWLATLLLKEGFGDATNFCSRLTFVSKVSKVVLPVFFHQLDACIVTRRGFETMTELNPQTGHQLKTLAVSPALVPFLFCFRTDYTSPIRKQVVAEIAKWHTTPAGRQILTIFQCDRLEEGTFSCLDSAQELLDTRRLLSGRTNPAPVSP